MVFKFDQISSWKEQAYCFFLDDSYIFSTYMTKKSWSDDSVEGLCVPTAEGNHLIIILAVKWVWSVMLFWYENSGSKQSDCHEQMNTENRMKRAKEKLVPSLPSQSVVVVDSEPCHNTKADKALTRSWKNWLTGYTPFLIKYVEATTVGGG
jgi:hypothetical protein